MGTPWSSGELAVHPNKKYLVNGDKPFFWLGDTAWTLFHRLSMKEARSYLINRKTKGYNVILSILLNHSEDPKQSNQRFDSGNLSETIGPENKEYWSHVKEIVSLAEDMGMYVALLPAWGRAVNAEMVSRTDVSEYTEFLRNSFIDRKNIIWLLGGDIRGDLHYELWNDFGMKLKSVMPRTLIGYHPFGRTSSTYWFADCEWLDFHMFQSGHRRDDQKALMSWDETASEEPWFGEDNWKYVLQDHQSLNLKPTIDGEPSYEQIPQGLHDPSEPYWQARHVRRYAYWSVLSGAFGHTYGHNAIFQFHGKGFEGRFGVKQSWKEALHASGGSQMHHLKDLMMEIDFVHCTPMQHILLTKETGDERIAAFGNEKNIVIYTYKGSTFSVTLPSDFTQVYQAYWIDPANGTRSYIDEFRLTESMPFTPPAKDCDSSDWILYLKQKDSLFT